MRCPACSQANQFNAGFCAFCGSPMPSKRATKTESPQEVTPTGPGSSTRETSTQTYLGNSLDIYSIIERWWTLIFSSKNETETTEDLAHGQMVIIAARWVLVVAGLTLAMWNPAAMGELRVSVVLILGLAVANFFLHTQVLMRGPVLSRVAYAASAADIAVISLVIIVGGQFGAGPYVFYFPAILALSVAFRTNVTVAFAAAAIALYALISLATISGGEGATLITRMLMLAGTAVCGNVYWRIERDRRLAAAEGRDTLKAEFPREVVTH